MNKFSKLINNSVIFAVGNFGSKFISLFMVPLYTFALSTSEYGKVDLITNTISLLIPFVTLSLDQALLRMIMFDKNEKDKDKYLTITLSFYFVFFLIILLTAIPLMYFFHLFQGMRFNFFLLLFLNGTQLILLQYCRGIGELKKYAVNGILQTLVFAILNILLLVNFKLGIVGYLYSLIIGTQFSVVYLVISLKVWESINFKKLDYKNTLVSMINYSIPLIPNSIMWWVVNNSTRYIIAFFLGVGANGLFAVASKIPTIITTFTGIFTQAWQLSAFEEFDSDDRGDFYSKVFELYYQFLFIISSFILIFLIPITKVLINESYYMSFKIVPFLIIGTIFQTLSGFLGSIYTAGMRTKGVFSSSLIGALISIFVNIVAIPLFGIVSLGIGTAIGFFIMFLIRLKSTRKIVYTSVNNVLLYVNFLIFLVQSIFIIFGYRFAILNIFIQVSMFLLLVYINKEILFILLKKFKIKK